jgi:hypothetical protein
LWRVRTSAQSGAWQQQLLLELGVLLALDISSPALVMLR